MYVFDCSRNMEHIGLKCTLLVVLDVCIWLLKVYSLECFSARSALTLAVHTPSENMHYIAEQCNAYFWLNHTLKSNQMHTSFFCWRHETWNTLLCNVFHVSDSTRVPEGICFTIRSIVKHIPFWKHSFWLALRALEQLSRNMLYNT